MSRRSLLAFFAASDAFAFLRRAFLHFLHWFLYLPVGMRSNAVASSLLSLQS